MSRKRKHNNVQQTDNSQNNNESMLSNLSDTANSALDSARTTASNNKGILIGVGVCAAVAGYLFGTEHGRNMQSQIGETLKDSFDRIRSGAMTGWDKVRTIVQDQIDSLSEESEQAEKPSEAVRLDKLRRVV